MDRLQAVAVQDGDVVIAALHHDEQVQRVGVELRPRRQRVRPVVLDARGADVGFRPARRRHHGRVEEPGESLDFLGAQGLAERRHLHPRPAVADHARGFGFLQARQVLRQQRRPHAAQAVGAVAARAVLLIGGVCEDDARQEIQEKGK